ncbi:DUF7114 family protein [Natronosalvus halobius]|uniref:DUF7114 family protein n=1 Tax=Natronosalvus halobius TaxID=2953746 RepID=UPI00209E610B|nr:hypothetical protein [Natronosalvus halobius]USZ70526.1 hypothetical protein NGM15_10425 [Natronosalvus halobius]
MDRVDTCRGAARDALADVEPAALHDFLTDTLETASMTPGVLTLASASVLERAESRPTGDQDSSGAKYERSDGHDESNGETASRESPGAPETENRPAADDPTSGESGDSLEGIAHHAAGVQLIYEGLRLTRALAHDEPWAETTGDSRADLEILAADILVARGFYLLARTDAADTAVRTVRRFGRDQTTRVDADETDAAVLDGNLEQDVLELAIRTGATVADADPTPELLAVATEVADATVTTDAGLAFLPAAECLPDLEAFEVDADDERDSDDAGAGVGESTDEDTSEDKRKRDLERPPVETEIPTDRVTSTGDH